MERMMLRMSQELSTRTSVIRNLSTGYRRDARNIYTTLLMIYLLVKLIHYRVCRQNNQGFADDSLVLATIFYLHLPECLLRTVKKLSTKIGVI